MIIIKPRVKLFHWCHRTQAITVVQLLAGAKKKEEINS